MQSILLQLQLHPVVAINVTEAITFSSAVSTAADSGDVAADTVVAALEAKVVVGVLVTHLAAVVVVIVSIFDDDTATDIVVSAAIIGALCFNYQHGRRCCSN